MQVSDEKERYKLAGMVAIPCLVLHELMHKFVAISFGYAATYHANIFGLFIGVAFKTLGLPIFFIPAYVSVNSLFANNLQMILISLAGPFANIVLFGISYAIEPYIKKRNHLIVLYLTRRINLILLVLNILPIPGTDGFNALSNILALI